MSAVSKVNASKGQNMCLPTPQLIILLHHLQKMPFEERLVNGAFSKHHGFRHWHFKTGKLFGFTLEWLSLTYYFWGETFTLTLKAFFLCLSHLRVVGLPTAQ